VYHPRTKKVEVTRNIIFNEGDTYLQLGKILKDVELTKGKQVVVNAYEESSPPHSVVIDPTSIDFDEDS